MRNIFFGSVALGLSVWAMSIAGSAGAVSSRDQLKLLTPSGYLPGIPILVRLEVVDPAGRRDWALWDAEATLSADRPGITFSTNRVVLRNGIGSALLSIAGESDFRLLAQLGSLETDRPLQALSPAAATNVGGTLLRPNTSWSGIIHVTNEVVVPMGYTLTIQSNTFVLIDGVTNGTIANDIVVNGTLQSLGTEAYPVTITCADPDPQFRWGQIRHSYARPSVYRHTMITRGGRGDGEGHTGTAPVLRPTASSVLLENCSLTDFSEWSRSSPEFGRPGKVLQSSLGSDLTLVNCLMARARMGPEISETSLHMTNCCIMEMYGVDDSDGLFLDAQQPGQEIYIADTVLVDGDDDGIDTLSAVFTLENCIVRGWRNPLEDSKGISLEGGDARLRRCLVADTLVGISGKGNNGVTVRLSLDRCTVLAVVYAVGATNKSGTLPVIDYRITNSILRGVSDTVFTQYNPADIRVFYSNVGESWPGAGNNYEDPRFVDTAASDYRLQADSPCIDAGNPAGPGDADGSVADMGFYTFLPPPPRLSQLQVQGDGSVEFFLEAHPGREYVIERSTNLPAWSDAFQVFQAQSAATVRDGAAPDGLGRFYRARLAP